MPFSFRKEGYQPPSKGRGSRLSPKMEMFVSEYMIDFSGSRAVLAAGYKTKNPDMMSVGLLNHPLVKAKIDELKKERFVKNELSAEYVIQKLMKIGEETSTSNPQASIRVLELLGKTLGIFKERQEISGPDGDAIRYEQKVREDVDTFTNKIIRLSEVKAKES